MRALGLYWCSICSCYSCSLAMVRGKLSRTCSALSRFATEWRSDSSGNSTEFFLKIAKFHWISLEILSLVLSIVFGWFFELKLGVHIAPLDGRGSWHVLFPWRVVTCTPPWHPACGSSISEIFRQASVWACNEWSDFLDFRKFDNLMLIFDVHSVR